MSTSEFEQRAKPAEFAEFLAEVATCHGDPIGGRDFKHVSNFSFVRSSGSDLVVRAVISDCDGLQAVDTAREYTVSPMELCVLARAASPLIKMAVEQAYDNAQDDAAFRRACRR